MGISKLKSRDPWTAKVHFDEALAKDERGENPGIFDGLGQCYHKMGKYDDAIREYTSAIDAER